MSIHRPTVLILASNPAFAREITAQWPDGPGPHSSAPEFIVLDEQFSQHLLGSHYDLAIADASAIEKDSLNKGQRRRLLNKRLNKDLRQSLAVTGKPAIVIHSDPSREFYNIHGTVIDLRREPEIWPAIVGLVGRAILQRHEAELRARKAETRCAAAEAEATLGRFMLEMRVNVNNALTTVLGNADLLVHEPGLPATVHTQADAIRSMAMRLHEMFQRFCSIEKELGVTNRETAKKAAAGV